MIKKNKVAFIIQIILFIVLVLSILFLPYKNNPKIIYSKTAFLVVVLVFQTIYSLKLYLFRKKSSTDVAIVLLLFLLIWEVSYKLGYVSNELFVPSPEGMFNVFVEKKDEVITGVISSLKLLSFGVFLAVVIGVILGIIVGFNKRLKETVSPIVNVVSPIPPLVYTPYLVAVLPTFRIASIFVIFLAVFWPTFQQMVNRVSQIDKAIIDSARVMNVSSFLMLFKVVLPYCLPGVIGGLSQSLRGAFMCLTGAEMLGSSSGIGFFIQKYNSNLNFRCILAGIVVMGVFVTIIDMGVKLLQKKIIKWEYN